MEKFHYPCGKRTKQNTESMRKAEKNLDLFWSEVDRGYVQRTGETIQKTLGLQLRELKRTPEWIEPVKVSKKILESHTSTVTDVFGSLSVETEKRSIPPSRAKAKTKTRPQSQPSKSTAIKKVIPPPQDIFDHQPIFALPHAALRVFSTLFFTPSTADHPGEISWQSFISAMEKVGFQSRKLHGSIWQFSPANLNVERSIQFHEPHPRGKFPFKVARRMGRRLSKAYGWHSGMFVLKDRETDEKSVCVD